MQSVTLSEVRRYCKENDDPETNALLEELADSCEAYLLRQNIPLTAGNQPRFALCVKAMTLHELDHPGEPYSGGIREKINDLKFNH